MALIIGKQGSGSNIPKAPGTGTGLRCLGGETSEDLLRNAVARGITLYTVRNANPITGSFDIVATKDLKSYKTLAQYAEELGLSVAEREEIEQNVTALLEEKNGIFVPPGYGLHFVLCIALIDGLTVLHQKVAPYLLRARGNSLILHIPKKWDYIGVSAPWTEEAAAEIHGENLKLYGENDVSVSLVPALNASLAGWHDYDLFQQNDSVYSGALELGALLQTTTDLMEQGAFFANLFQRVTPPPFGTYRMDAWPEDVDKCRVPALQWEAMEETTAYFRVKALIPGGPVSFEQRNLDPNSIAAFFNTAPHQFENYRIQTMAESDYSLAKTPTPVSQGGLGPVRPGLYYKAGRIVAIITGEYYGHIKGETFSESGTPETHADYEKVTGTDGVITHATSWTEIPSDARVPDEIGWADDLVRGQNATATRLVRHFLHELSEPAAATDDGAIEFRIALTIKTGTTERLVDHYRSTTVSIEGFSKDDLSFDWRANLGTEENPVEAFLEKSTDENGRQVLIVPLDQGALATETNADGLLFYSPLQVVTVIIYARFTSSSVVGSFRTAPDEELDFDTYQPYEIRDLGIRSGAANMLPRGGA